MKHKKCSHQKNLRCNFCKKITIDTFRQRFYLYKTNGFCLSLDTHITNWKIVNIKNSTVFYVCESCGGKISVTFD